MTVRKLGVGVAAGAVLAALVGAMVASATPSTGLTAAFTARGTIAENVTISVPRTVTVTRRIRYRTRTGRIRFRTVRVQVTRQQPLATCTSAAGCDIVHQSITFAPGGSTGWHSHPGVVFLVVKSGTLTRYHARDCMQERYDAGRSFTEQGPQHTIVVRNETSAPAEAAVVYVVPAGTPNANLRVDQPAPTSGTCATIP